MVKNSNKTYGELMLEARSKTDRQEVGETLQVLLKHLENLIDEAVNLQAEKGKFYKKYYIWIRFRKEPYANNALHIYPQCRLTRPSPYQDEDHILWSVTNMNEIKYEWNVMSEEMTAFVLANKPKFHEQTVAMAKSYKEDKIDKIEDYMIGDKVI